MATTAAKQQSSSVRRSSSSSPLPSSQQSSPTYANNDKIGGGVGGVGIGGDGGSGSAAAAAAAAEDIETIAKQISDHAEAIYQTWKARGLAPTEILHCHTGNTDAFGKSLTPSAAQQTTTSSRTNKKETTTTTNQNNVNGVTAELFAQSPVEMSNNNLEKLVSSFVNEDKARQQAAARSKTTILTSGTIKDALRKFESADSRHSAVKPNFLRSSSYTSPSSTTTTTSSSSETNSGRSSIDRKRFSVPSTTADETSAVAFTTKLNKNVPDVLMNTIDQTDNNQQQHPPKEESPPPKITTTTTTTKTKPETPQKPANLINHTPTWPLKNRLSIGGSGKKVIKESASTTGKTSKSAKNAAELLDEVLIEEERLINALKTGTVLNNDQLLLPEVITSTLTKDSATAVKLNRAKVMAATTQDQTDSPPTAAAAATTTAASSVSPPHQPPHPSHQRHNEFKAAEETAAPGGGTSSAIKITKQPRPRNDAAVPHPEHSANAAKLGGPGHVGVGPRNSSTTPAVRPFLTRGSVAERVLMFEKCPEVKALRAAPKDPSKLSVSLTIFSI